MQILNFNYNNDGKNVVTFEMKNSEISAICYYLESLIILGGETEDKKTLHELHDSLLKVISAYRFDLRMHEKECYIYEY